MGKHRCGRPLTYIYDDPNELRAIKPSDFIQDIKGSETMDLDIVDAKYLRKRIRYLQKPTLSTTSTISEGIFIRAYSESTVIFKTTRNYPSYPKDISPLELSSSEILNDVPVRVKDSSDTSDNDNQHTVSNEQSFEPKDLPKEQLETLKRSRFGRQIVPVKRLDL
ncbi:integrase catalytic domain-containing protein [Caerostris extrusa]|uniref:Integrase catalytic domain-containing protein n=1 Tax=Caerostris extrusa TaxID=172846 RepID=A0AAV4TX41_CAEEX|nr:integrase catalytic domain-containing protein [Caerostris extrusa]